MKSFKEFLIPLSGLEDGIHHFEFTLGKEFFENFEKSPIKDGVVLAKVDLDKRSSMLVLEIDISGTIAEKCDRCLVEIKLPIQGEYRLIGKYGEGEEDIDVFYLSRDDVEFNIASYLYELSCLAVPISKTYDCWDEEDRPCDDSMLEEIQEEEDESSRLGDELKNLKFDN